MKSMRLENVKAFVDTNDVQLAPLTVFVGKNSCGKSSFIRFPQVLKQTFSSGMDTPIYLNGTQEDCIDYGTFQDVLHNGEGESFSVSLTYPFDYTHFTSDVDNPQFNNEITIKISYSRLNSAHEKRVFAKKIELFVDGLFFSGYTKGDSDREYVFKQEKTIQNGELISSKYSCVVKAMFVQNFMPVFSPLEVAEAIYKKYKDSKAEISYEELTQIIGYRGHRANKDDMESESEADITAKKAYEAFTLSSKVFSYVYEAMQREFTRLKYIGPFRSAPQRYYRVDEIAHNDVGVSGNYTSSLLINSNDTLKKSVSEWFEDAFSNKIQVNPVGEGTGLYKITAIDLKESESTNEIGNNLVDVGYGFSQILPIVTQLKKTQIDGRKKKQIGMYAGLAYSDIIVIEQPELHLHPAAQSKLASLFASTICQEKNGKSRKLLIETHSEHLIRALQYLIAKTDNPLTKDMVKFYYIDKTNNGSIIKEMKINEMGQLMERWPKGFFDEAQTMSRKLMDAIAERRFGEE